MTDLILRLREDAHHPGVAPATALQAADEIERLRAELETAAMTNEDRPSWDDRKDLLELWQAHAPLPDIALRDGIYDALLAVAGWGYDRASQDLGS